MMKGITEYVFEEPFIRTFMMPAVMPNNPMNDNKQENILNQNKFVNIDEGFLRGNMEKGTYIPYKNMTYIKPTLLDERQRALFEIQKLAFAAHDTNLYLDTHPNDSNMIKLYNDYQKEEKRLCDLYERRYGPIDLSDPMGLEMTPWAWIKEPWPWNK